jgi:hypothetical protein
MINRIEKNEALPTLPAAALSTVAGAGPKTGRMSQTARDAVYDHYFETWGGNQNMSIRTTATKPNGWDYLVRQRGQSEGGFVDTTGDVFPARSRRRDQLSRVNSDHQPT